MILKTGSNKLWCLSARTTDFLVGPLRMPTCVQTHACLRIPVTNRDNCIDVHISYHGYFTPTHSVEFVVVKCKRDLLLKAAEQGQGAAVSQSQGRHLLPALLIVGTKLRWE